MRVLIIDDEPLVRRSLERVFQKNSHPVETAANGIDGLKKWKEFKPDLVLLDVLMPGLTGPEVLQRVDRPLSTKVILMSAFTGDSELSRAKDLGADLFLPKPFDDIFEVYRKSILIVEGST